LAEGTFRILKAIWWRQQVPLNDPELKPAKEGTVPPAAEKYKNLI
jgi:hypothetical protein